MKAKYKRENHFCVSYAYNFIWISKSTYLALLNWMILYVIKITIPFLFKVLLYHYCIKKKTLKETKQQIFICFDFEIVKIAF